MVRGPVMSRPAFPSLNDNIYRYITAFNWTGLEAGCPVYGRLLATAELNDAIAIELSVHPRGLFVRNVCIAKTQIIYYSLLVVGNGRIQQTANDKPLQKYEITSNKS
jgi:hypothetical protein